MWQLVTLLFFRWYIVLSVLWEFLIAFLLKDGGDSLRLLHLTAFFCIEAPSRTRLLNIVLIITILFFIFTGVLSRCYSYDRLFPGCIVNHQVWMLVLKCDFNKLAMKLSWNHISTGQLFKWVCSVVLAHVFVRVSPSGCSCW